MLRRTSVRWSAVLAVLVMASTAACDDDGAVEPDRLDIEQVSGEYEPTTFTFDVQGSLPEKDILARVESAIDPQLNIADDGTFQLLVDLPERGLVVLEGTVELGTETVALDFNQPVAAGLLLLPGQAEFRFDAAAGTLTLVEKVEVSRERLVELIPEFEDEPLSDPVPGELRLVFTRI